MKKKLLKLTWPIFVENLLFILLGSMDTLMLSHYSDTAVAGVGVANELISMVVLLFGVITIGTAILCAQYAGAGEQRKVHQVVGVSLLFNGLIGSLFSILLVFGGPHLLELMEVRPEVMSHAKSYLQIIGSVLFVQALGNTVAASMRSLGYTKASMFISVAMNIFNIAGNYFLIFGKAGLPALGASGAALSTSISRVLSVLVMCIFLFKKVLKDFKWRNLMPFPYAILQKVLKVGIPSALEQLSWQGSQLILIYFINAISDTALTTRAYIMTIACFSSAFAYAIAQGTAINIGHLVGDDKKEGAYKLCLSSLKIGVLFSIGFSALFYLNGRSILGFFTENKEVITLGMSILLVDVFLEPGRAFNLVVIDALRAAGDVKFPVQVGICSMWLVGVGVAWILGIGCELGLVGIWIALAMDEWLRGLLMLVRWRGKKWINMDFVHKGMGEIGA